MAVIVGTAATGRTETLHHDQRGQTERHVRVLLRPGVIDLYHSASISVSGLAATRIDVRLLGGIDRTGPAYQWTPYRWHPLRLLHGVWSGALVAPPLFGIYQLQLRLDQGHRLLSSTGWLLRIFPRGTTIHPSFPTAVAAVRHHVAHLPGDEVLAALKRWPQAAFDHRDPRLHRIFVIAYAPRGDNRPSSRLGLFITTVRDGFHGRWRLLQATTQPYE